MNSNEKYIQTELMEISYENLNLDFKNPRLPESVSKLSKEEELLEYIEKAYSLKELALSMLHNGFFKGEPLIAIPVLKKNCDEYINNSHKAKQYIVVEGNRRLSTIKLIIRKKFDNLLGDENNFSRIISDAKNLPVVVYPNRDSVLDFLGVRHLAGVRKWNAYEKARYVVQLKNSKENYSISKIQEVIGDTSNNIRKLYISYQLVQQVKEYDNNFDIKRPKDDFSFLQLALGQKPIKEYIGLKGIKDVNEEQLNYAR